MITSYRPSPRRLPTQHASHCRQTRHRQTRQERLASHGITAIAAASSTSSPQSGARRMRYVGLTALILLLLQVALSSCSFNITNGSPTPPSAHGSPTSATATPLIPVSTPPAPLAVAPSDCPAPPATRSISPNLGPVIGGTPVWTTLAPVVRIPTSYNTYTPYGWEWKVIWEVGPQYTQVVAVRGGLLAGDQPPLWFQVDVDQSATTTPLLDPQHPNHGSSLGNGWAEWGTYVFFPVAGCYFVDATWPQGHWRVIIAVGR